MVARGLKSRVHPILAQVVPIRRCNLSCAYCNEFDDHSQPVPTPEMLARIDRLAALGTTIVDLSGGEPLLHPELDAIITRIRQHDMLAGLLTNGYLLSAERVKRLNRAGLDHLQISIDNVTPDETSTKSLQVLDGKLQVLARQAEFAVNINSVLGGGLLHPGDALAIARRSIELGFTATVGLIHGRGGQLLPLTPAEREAYEAIQRLTAPFYSVGNQNTFQRNLVRGVPNDWRCRAGSRYLYICEDGLVHWCSQQRGYPAIRLSEYGPEHLAREHQTSKSCAPLCTVSCVHRVALLDRLREAPLDTIVDLLPGEGASARRAPASVRVLRWMFVTSRQRHLFRAAAARVLRVR